ncbi:Cytochrome subunit of sulfide dehydrogenase [Tepidimonas fonticaldi]|uniref:Cytochrome subunit of sulfide dehydrogenase n=1 Tax=Tepidimonas fonticaldi TaxID=1101373 RepID=A0A554XLF3_9BURK|nr:c-type cytochrome [Tepidimonas fonticaldi]TSE36655.1 Cytochrome subunit of sulfide dehydrogenase [Tepidimonas fonticaldi]
MKAYQHILAAGLLGAATLAQAQVDQVKVWAAACANCHGTNGHAQPGMEALAGKDKDEILQKLLDFKNGRKPATLMHQLAKGYTDDELRAISAYFAAQKKQ